jgi:hypothetical protein
MWCPGCKGIHAINDTWNYDGNAESPTISPSLLIQYGSRPEDKRCHSFIVNGQWQFLSDCSHELAGQTVSMVDIPEGER